MSIRRSEAVLFSFLLLGCQACGRANLIGSEVGDRWSMVAGVVIIALGSAYVVGKWWWPAASLPIALCAFLVHSMLKLDEDVAASIRACSNELTLRHTAHLPAPSLQEYVRCRIDIEFGARLCSQERHSFCSGLDFAGIRERVRAIASDRTSGDWVHGVVTKCNRDSPGFNEELCMRELRAWLFLCKIDERRYAGCLPPKDDSPDKL